MFKELQQRHTQQFEQFQKEILKPEHSSNSSPFEPCPELLNSQKQFIQHREFYLGGSNNEKLRMNDFKNFDDEIAMVSSPKPEALAEKPKAPLSPSESPGDLKPQLEPLKRKTT